MLDSHIINALGWTLIHFLWQGMAIVGTYWLISRCSKSLHAKYWTGMVAVMLCLLIPISQFISLAQTNEFTGSVFTLNNSIQTMALKPLSTWETLLILTNQSLPYLVMIWAAVVVILTSGLIRSWFKLNAIEHDCEPKLSAELKQFIKNTAIKLDLATIPILKVSKEILVPAAYGIYKPTVLLPLSLLSQIPKDQVHAVITHELCHLKRNDFLHNILQLTADILLFFHPAIRWMNNDIRQVREQCCDQLVLSQNTHAITYAKALTNIASITQGHHFTPSLQIGIHDGLLLKRVKYLLQNKSSQSSIMMFVPLTALLLACFYLFQSNQAPLGSNDSSINQDNGSTTNLNKQFTNHLFYPQKQTKITQTTAIISESVVGLPDRIDRSQPELNVDVNSHNSNAIDSQSLQAELNAAFAMPEIERMTALENTPSFDLASIDVTANKQQATNNESSAHEPSLMKPKLKAYLSPEYPSEFWQRQIEQTVIASFKIKPNGKPYDIQVNSQKNNYAAFEQSVKTTLRNWRFERDSLNRSNLQRTYQQIFDFEISQKVIKNCKRATTGSRMKRSIACNK